MDLALEQEKIKLINKLKKPITSKKQEFTFIYRDL